MEEYPKTRERDDFWKQVKRTINGIPVSREQINMIVSAVRTNLDLQEDDILLDLGCGNGALSKYFFDDITSFHGIDISDYFIDIAKEYFERPNFTFQESDIISYIEGEEDPERFTKCLCYGVFSYLSYSEAEIALQSLSKCFKNLRTMLIGNLPDRDRAHSWYYKNIDYSQLLDNHNETIGIWRTKDDFVSLAHKTGWDIEFRHMPDNFYAARYRYDVVLRRRL